MTDFDEKLNSIITKHEELSQKMADPSAMSSNEFVAISKEYSDLGDVVEKITLYQGAKQLVVDCDEIINDADSDQDMIEMAKEEKREAEDQVPLLIKEIQLALLPKDAADEKNAILEVRAGTGGDEAALFASDLFHM